MYIIIGGGGQVGYYLSKMLVNQGHEVVLLEKERSRYSTLAEILGATVVQGDACEARIMEEAGCHRADLVIAVTGDDEDNLVICQMAKRRFGVARAISRVNNPGNESIFQKLGIDVTVCPTNMILSLVEAELPTHSLVHLMTLRSAGLELIAVHIPKKSPVIGKPLRNLKLPLGCNLVVITRGADSFVPTAETTFTPGDEIYALVKAENEDAVRNVLIGVQEYSPPGVPA